MNSELRDSPVLPDVIDYLDIVDTALATISRRLPAHVNHARLALSSFRHCVGMSEISSAPTVSTTKPGYRGNRRGSKMTRATGSGV